MRGDCAPEKSYKIDRNWLSPPSLGRNGPVHVTDCDSKMRERPGCRPLLRMHMRRLWAAPGGACVVAPTAVEAGVAVALNRCALRDGTAQHCQRPWHPGRGDSRCNRSRAELKGTHAAPLACATQLFPAGNACSHQLLSSRQREAELQLRSCRSTADSEQNLICFCPRSRADLSRVSTDLLYVDLQQLPLWRPAFRTSRNDASS